MINFWVYLIDNINHFKINLDIMTIYIDKQIDEFLF